MLDDLGLTKKGRLKKKLNLLITVPNIAIRNYIKAKIDNTKNRNCRLFSYKDEIVNHIIRKFS